MNVEEPFRPAATRLDTIDLVNPLENRLALGEMEHDVASGRERRGVLALDVEGSAVATVTLRPETVSGRIVYLRAQRSGRVGPRARSRTRAQRAEGEAARPWRLTRVYSIQSSRIDDMPARVHITGTLRPMPIPRNDEGACLQDKSQSVADVDVEHPPAITGPAPSDRRTSKM